MVEPQQTAETLRAFDRPGTEGFSPVDQLGARAGWAERVYGGEAVPGPGSMGRYSLRTCSPCTSTTDPSWCCCRAMCPSACLRSVSR